MKHIRKFNIESKDLEDLEDYLQEIFDKYHIRKSQPTGQESDMDILSGPIYYTKVDINGNESLFLDNLEFKFYYNLLEDIRKLKPTIEKRLGYPIGIFPDQYIDFIKILPYLPKKLWENVENIRMPRKCTMEEIVQKVQIHKEEKWTDIERKFFKNFVFDHEIGEDNLCIRNLFIRKRQDDWFSILIIGNTHHFDEFYIADEFIEVENFVKSYALPI